MKGNYINSALHKKIECLIDAVKTSNNRSRFVFLAIVVSSLVVIISTYNYSYSWMTHINYNERPNFAAKQGILPKNSLPIESSPDELEKNILGKMFAELFIRRITFSIPFVGIEAFAFDLSLIGGVTFVVLMTWFFFTVRRENHVVSETFRVYKQISEIGIAESEDKILDSWDIINLLDHIFHSTIHSFVFLTTTKLDNVNRSNSKETIDTNRFGRIVVSTLFYLPTIALSFLLVTDLCSWGVEITPGKTIISQYTTEVLFRDLVCFFAICYCTYQSWNITKLNNSTVTYFREMRSSLQEIYVTNKIEILSDSYSL